MAKSIDGPTAEHHLAPVITWRSALVRGSVCSTCKLVGLTLSLYMNELGGSAFPSVNRLAEDTSLSERSVRQHLNEHLHKEGWLELVERGGQKGDRRRANEWRASTPAGDAGVEDAPRQEVPRPRQEVPPTPAAGAPQVVHELDQEVVAVGTRVCCGQTFPTLDTYQDHLESCEAIEA